VKDEDEAQCNIMRSELTDMLRDFNMGSVKLTGKYMFGKSIGEEMKQILTRSDYLSGIGSVKAAKGKKQLKHEKLQR